MLSRAIFSTESTFRSQISGTVLRVSDPGSLTIKWSGVPHSLIYL